MPAGFVSTMAPASALDTTDRIPFLFPMLPRLVLIIGILTGPLSLATLAASGPGPAPYTLLALSCTTNAGALAYAFSRHPVVGWTYRVATALLLGLNTFVLITLASTS